MRLLLKIVPVKNVSYDMNYHYNLQGLIYRMLRGSLYDKIHDKPGYKFFCYSNIFPFQNILDKSRIYNLLISSPSDKFIETIYQKFVNWKKFKINNMEFMVEYAQINEIIIPDEAYTIITGTPVVIRIKKEFTEELNRIEKDYKYFYWRRNFPIDTFIKQVTSNLVKKYIEYNSISETTKSKNDLYSLFLSFFQKFRYKKQVSNVIYIKGSSHIIIGSLWEFEFEGWENKEIIKFAMNCGLGERNSLGFGFLNISTKDQWKTIC